MHLAYFTTSTMCVNLQRQNAQKISDQQEPVLTNNPTTANKLTTSTTSRIESDKMVELWRGLTTPIPRLSQDSTFMMSRELSQSGRWSAARRLCRQTESGSTSWSHCLWRSGRWTAKDRTSEGWTSEGFQFAHCSWTSTVESEEMIYSVLTDLSHTQSSLIIAMFPFSLVHHLIGFTTADRSGVLDQVPMIVKVHSLFSCAVLTSTTLKIKILLFQ
jgi:hypothetical protein